MLSAHDIFEMSQPEKVKKKQTTRPDRRRINFSSMVVYAFIGAMLVGRIFFFSMIEVSGESMSPTLHTSDRLVLMRHTSIDRFDIVVFDREENGTKLVKRVVGMPGDTVSYIDCVLVVNGESIVEPYLTASAQDCGDDLAPQQVAEGAYIVFGDNRQGSLDSRALGPIRHELVVGEVSARLWPASTLLR